MRPFVTLVAWLLLVQEAAPPVAFLDAEKARDAVVDDRDEPYFILLRPHDMSSKTGRPIGGSSNPERLAECRRRYQAACRDFTPSEKELLRQAVERLRPALSADAPAVAALPWSFLKTDGSIEGGFPHTRGSHIVLPLPTLARWERTARRSPEEALFAATSLLAHEQLHVFQRKHPRRMDGLYTEVWGFLRVPQIEGCPWLDRHEVVNPDATDLGWILPLRDGGRERLVWPRVLFKDEEPAEGKTYVMGPDFRMSAVEVERTAGSYRVKTEAGGRPVMEDLLSVREYMARFPGETYVYHPAEAAAAYFGTIAAIDALGLRDRLPERVRKEMEANQGRVREWFRGHLK